MQWRQKEQRIVGYSGIWTWWWFFRLLQHKSSKLSRCFSRSQLSVGSPIAAHLECPSSPLDPSRSLWCPAPWRWPSLQSLLLALPPSLVAWAMSSVLWRHFLQHITTHNSGVSIHLFISVLREDIIPKAFRFATQEFQIHTFILDFCNTSLLYVILLSTTLYRSVESFALKPIQFDCRKTQK